MTILPRTPCSDQPHQLPNGPLCRPIRLGIAALATILSVVAVMATSGLIGCRAEVMKVPEPVVEHTHIVTAACFACRDRETLTEALELRKTDREAFAKLRTSGKIIPVGRGERVKLLATAQDGTYAKIRLKKDPNDFWTLTQWLKPYDPEKAGPKTR